MTVSPASGERAALPTRSVLIAPATRTVGPTPSDRHRYRSLRLLLSDDDDVGRGISGRIFARGAVPAHPPVLLPAERLTAIPFRRVQPATCRAGALAAGRPCPARPRIHRASRWDHCGLPTTSQIVCLKNEHARRTQPAIRFVPGKPSHSRKPEEDTNNRPGSPIPPAPTARTSPGRLVDCRGEEESTLGYSPGSPLRSRPGSPLAVV